MGKIILKRKTYSIENIAKGIGGGYLLHNVLKNGKDQPLINNLLKSGLGIGLLNSALKGNQRKGPGAVNILGTLAIGGLLYNKLKNKKKAENEPSYQAPEVKDDTISTMLPMPKKEDQPEPSPVSSKKPESIYPDPVPMNQEDEKEKVFSIKFAYKKK